MQNQKIGPVAACGLYCGACGKYTKGKCAGCRDNLKASWCGIRKCCIDNNYVTCADCSKFDNPRDCKVINNLPGKIIGFLTGSDRFACIGRIKEVGVQSFAIQMQTKGWQSIKKGNNN